jgi:ergothioneine biosynthesis protein EgtB
VPTGRRDARERLEATSQQAFGEPMVSQGVPMLRSTPARRAGPTAAETAPERFARTRQRTTGLVAHLPPEDLVVQSMEDASPGKWHLAHTSWFFEEFILRRFEANHRAHDERFLFLFNSYYAQAGLRYSRAHRGLVTRPTVEEVHGYRRRVDDAILALLEAAHDDQRHAIETLVELGCHHEMQHQELMLTDLLHAYSFNPLMPAYKAPAPLPIPKTTHELGWVGFDGGIVEVGHSGDGFSFDNEQPRHRELLTPFRLGTRAVTNREWIEFIEDRGYQTEPLWLSDGWARLRAEAWQAPLYWWKETDGSWWSLTLRGPQPVSLDAPVCHVSYYEADAFAQWAGKRLPSEAEWEVAAAGQEIEGNLLDTDLLRPRPAKPHAGLTQIFGDVWEWTRSPYVAYPGFQAPRGAIGEYNGKFMCNQMVLRGGACTTPNEQMRASYRNFFYPHMRWQVTGLRLAEDG